jgi:hypothetical protein
MILLQLLIVKTFYNVMYYLLTANGFLPGGSGLVEKMDHEQKPVLADTLIYSKNFCPWIVTDIRISIKDMKILGCYRLLHQLIFSMAAEMHG